jgi:alkyldihydroxyacetonephosphate synthase
MRRWNGWGDDGNDFPLGTLAQAYLAARIGEGHPRADASREQAVAGIRPPRGQWGARWQTSAQVRLDHARGQSFPDWLALKSGRIGSVADAVAFPESSEEVAEVLAEALAAGALVIPHGGGTSVVGHLDVPEGERPVVNIALSRLRHLITLDARHQLATFGAGIAGPALESQLRRQGYVLGHYPQSFEYSTLGGWVVTRSSGQQSYRYGRIEQLFHGGRLISPSGALQVGRVPASSAGPDLRELVLGSEGRLGLLTEATVRVRPKPAHESFHAVFFPSWDTALDGVRTMVQQGIPLSMLRVSNEVETETQLRLSGHEKLIAWLQRYLGLRGIGPGQCLLMIGVTGTLGQCRRHLREALAVAKRFRGVHVGKAMGQAWSRNRFRGPYLRNSLWQLGYGADTVETCVPWSQATPLMRALERTAQDRYAVHGERLLAFTHLSHVYAQGCSIYSTFVFPCAGDVDEDLARWRDLKHALSSVILAHGGTISHQHGVGRDHLPYLPEEKGALGMRMIRSAAEALDPGGQMNPGKLFA